MIAADNMIMQCFSYSKILISAKIGDENRCEKFDYLKQSSKKCGENRQSLWKTSLKGFYKILEK